MGAQTIRVSTQEDPPPEDLADPVEALMAPGGQRVALGAVTLEFWWVKSMPLVAASKTADWSAVEEGTLVGAVAVATAEADSRGRPIRPGLYTLRYASDPPRSDRPGAAPKHPLILLAPGGSDSSPAAVGRDAALALSRSVSGTQQPAAWQIDPAVGDRDVGSARASGGGRTTVVFAVPVSRDGSDAGVLKFGLVIPAGPRT
jgi:hypothetical protein